MFCPHYLQLALAIPYIIFRLCAYACPSPALLVTHGLQDYLPCLLQAFNARRSDIPGECQPSNQNFKVGLVYALIHHFEAKQMKSHIL